MYKYRQQGGVFISSQGSQGKYADEKIKYVIKELLQERSVDQINVSVICERAGVNRQTFYYYFKDLYDAIRTVLGNEYHQFIQPCRNSEDWPGILVKTLEFVQLNKEIANHLYFSNERERIKKDSEQYLAMLFRPSLVRLAEANNIHLSPLSLDYMIKVYRAGIIECVYLYIEEQMVEKPEVLVKKTAAVIQGSILKAMRALEKIELEASYV